MSGEEIESRARAEREAEDRKGGLRGPEPEERMRPTGRRNAQGIRIDPEAEAEHDPRRTVITALVENEPGVLSRVSGLFSRRQFNIESLTVGPTQEDDYSRITIVVEEPDPNVDQIEKQLSKLVPVVSARELDGQPVTRELVLLKVNGEEPDKVHAITGMYDGTTLDAGPRTITVQITGDEGKIDDAIDAYEQFGIREIARTGQAALARGETATAPNDAIAVTDGSGDGHTARPSSGTDADEPAVTAPANDADAPDPEYDRPAVTAPANREAVVDAPANRSSPVSAPANERDAASTEANTDGTASTEGTGPEEGDE
jgi:acetolactate synthase-1/3 small subunit